MRAVRLRRRARALRSGRNSLVKKEYFLTGSKRPKLSLRALLWFTGYTDIQLGSALAIASTISFAFSSPQRSRMSEARSRPIWMGPLNSVMLLYPFRQISAAVPHNRRHRMVGIAGYRQYCNGKSVKTQVTNLAECNTLNIFVQFSETALFLVEISQPAPRNPTKCCIIAHRSTAFTGRNGIMETGSPHYQQTFQHKRGAINDVMLT